MAIRKSSEAIRAALGQTRNVPGTCQKTVRTWFNAPSAGDQDGDGDADAVDGWKSEPVSARHPGDRNPPPGKPLSFGGGRKGFGHRALSLAKGVRSTDMNGDRYASGITSTVVGISVSAAIAKIERAMGVTYLGWSETIDGYQIPPEASTAPKPVPEPTPPNPNAVEDFRVASLNLMSLPRNPNLTETIRSVNTIPIVGIQEADLPAFKLRLQKRWPAIIGLGEIDDPSRAAPLVANANRFTHVRTGERLMHRAAAGISHKRFLTFAVIQFKDTKIKMAIINLHAVDCKKDDKYEKRLEMREQDKKALLIQVDHFIELGLPIIITGDFNDTANWLGGSSRGGRRVRRVRHKVDQIYTVDGQDERLEIISSNYVDNSSNHDALRARINLVER